MKIKILVMNSVCVTRARDLTRLMSQRDVYLLSRPSDMFTVSTPNINTKLLAYIWVI